MRNSVPAALIAAFLAIAGVVSPSVGDTVLKNNIYDLVVPDKSPVRFDTWEGYDYAKFRGEFVLTGTLRYGYFTETGKKNDSVGWDFAPDEAIAGTLPHWSGPLKLDSIAFDNWDDFIAAAIPGATVDRIKQEKTGVEARVTIRADRFATFVGCSTPTYRVRFIEIVKSSEVHVAQLATGELSGC